MGFKKIDTFESLVSFLTAVTKKYTVAGHSPPN